MRAACKVDRSPSCAAQRKPDAPNRTARAILLGSMPVSFWMEHLLAALFFARTKSQGPFLERVNSTQTAGCDIRRAAGYNVKSGAPALCRFGPWAFWFRDLPGWWRCSETRRWELAPPARRRQPGCTDHSCRGHATSGDTCVEEK